jgi:hypothetical protein
MLNDNLETVIKNYAHLLDDGTALKVDGWMETKLRKRREPDPASLPTKQVQDIALTFWLFSLVSG